MDKLFRGELNPKREATKEDHRSERMPDSNSSTIKIINRQIHQGREERQEKKNLILALLAHLAIRIET